MSHTASVLLTAYIYMAYGGASMPSDMAYTASLRPRTCLTTPDSPASWLPCCGKDSPGKGPSGRSSQCHVFLKVRMPDVNGGVVTVFYSVHAWPCPGIIITNSS